jgi:hypothetical protein
MGCKRYRNARKLLITADGGGSNGSRCPWKVALQDLAAQLGLAIHVCHFPPGTSKMEQDRASHIFPHHLELARAATGQPRGHRQPDRQYRDQNGF